MEKGNVLVIGNSGVGKSTLINAVLGEKYALTGCGIEGTTKHLEIYESQEIPFRIIDTVGFEPSFMKEMAAINAVKKWSKDSAKEGKTDNQINVIWFCVDGTSRKLFPKAIKDLTHATSMWPSIPVVVVITKSYAIPDRESNTLMVYDAFSSQKKYAKRLKKVIPVVAETYTLNENAYAPPEGITELIDTTNDLLPEGLKAAQHDIASYKLNRKRALAHSVVGAATTSGIVVGAVPIPFPDAMILGAVEIAEVNALAMIYGIQKNEESKEFLNSIVEAGTVSLAAKTAITTLKAMPGINIGATALNAVIAGCIIAALGEGSIYAFEQVYLGKKTVEDIDWVRKLIESQFSSRFIDKAMKIVQMMTEKADKNAVKEAIFELFNLKSSK